MTKVYTGATMSLDGFIADPNHGGFEYLFKWFNNGDVEVPSTRPDIPIRTSAGSARYLRELLDNTGVLVVGRTLFDITDGWGGNHPFGTPVIVVTHRVPEDWVHTHKDAPFTFVTDGIESAIDKAKAIAGDSWVGVNGGTIARQCLDAGLLDEVCVDVVPVLLGDGVPFFGRLKDAPVEFDGPSVIEGTGVTHLRYQVRKPTTLVP